MNVAFLVDLLCGVVCSMSNRYSGSALRMKSGSGDVVQIYRYGSIQIMKWKLHLPIGDNGC